MAIPFEDFLIHGLIQYNYFPTQKTDKGEIPPILSTKSFDLPIAQALDNLKVRKMGFDQVEYRATRFNNVPRIISIPHPLPYAKLCLSLYANWANIGHITKSKQSLIKPEFHRDGRVIIMDYESPVKKIERQINYSFNQKFLVETDIANFFPSIYTHSIPWALMGLEYAKTHTDPNQWFNIIDRNQRALKRNETNGIAIGPATSNIICELILSTIDKKLELEGFVFVRFIDDYLAYTPTYEKSEEFIRRLSEELSVYKLNINPRKTEIIPLPIPTAENWIVDLSNRIPCKDKINTSHIIRFLDYSVILQSDNPDGSIIKYAVKSIIKLVPDNSISTVLNYLLGLCNKYPVIIPTLGELFDKEDKKDLQNYSGKLNAILEEHTINRRSDAMSWILHYLNKYSIVIEKRVADLIIDSRNCIPILILFLSKKFDGEVINFCQTIQTISKTNSDIYLLDQYWILFYQLFLENKILNPYDPTDSGFETFNILKSNNVSFVI